MRDGPVSGIPALVGLCAVLRTKGSFQLNRSTNHDFNGPTIPRHDILPLKQRPVSFLVLGLINWRG